jgi:hypothetical protein
VRPSVVLPRRPPLSMQLELGRGSGTGSESELEPEPEPLSASVRVLQLGGAVGVLRIDEPFWSDAPASRGSGTGATLWDGAVVLARHLQQLLVQQRAAFAAGTAGAFLLQGRALELGAGCSGAIHSPIPPLPHSIY